MLINDFKLNSYQFKLILYYQRTFLLTDKYYYRNYLPSEVYSNSTSRVIKNNIDVENLRYERKI